MADEGTQLGKYVLKRKLATGGMAEIWLSEQRGPGGFAKELVIKRILPHLADDNKFVEMFLDEARLAAQLHHPNIVQIYDLGEASGSYFIAMEYIRGNDLEQLVDRAEEMGGCVDPHIAARVIADACGALDYAHTFTDPAGNCLNLVHRDISPQNILVDVQGVVKLVDFGVAKAATSTHKTQTGAVKGKFAYMSPEQIKGRKLDGRSDLFAMGIVLFELLTGVRPFGHDSEMMAVAAILDHPTPKPREVHKGVPKGLEKVVLKALEKKPEDRFESAEAMQVELETFLKESGKPIGTKDTKSYMVGLFGEQLSTRPIPARKPVDAMAATELEASGMAPPPGPAPPPPPQSLYSRETQRRGPDPKKVQTERVERSPSGGVGAGLIVALLFVFLALGGAGYFLYTTLTADEPVAQADAGEPVDEADAVVSGGDAGGVQPTVDAGMAASSDVDEPSLSDAEAVATADVETTPPDVGGVAVADDTGALTQVTPADASIDTTIVQIVPPGADVSIDPKADAPAQITPTDAGVVVAEDAATIDAPAEVAVTVQIDAAKDAEEEALVVVVEDAAEDTVEEAPATPEDVVEESAATTVTTAEDVAEERRRRRDRRRSTEPGTVTFRVVQRGRYEITLDGRRIGRSPTFPPMELPPGRYTFEARRISDDETRTETVVVESGERVRAEFDFGE